MPRNYKDADINDMIVMNNLRYHILGRLEDAFLVLDNSNGNELKMGFAMLESVCHRVFTPLEEELQEAQWEVIIKEFLALEAAGNVQRNETSVYDVRPDLWAAQAIFITQIVKSRGLEELPVVVIDPLELLARLPPRPRPILRFIRGGMYGKD